jgi:hypothetical protein
MERGLVGTEGNEGNDGTQGLQDCRDNGQQDFDQRSLFRSQWSLAKEERDIG